MADPEHVEPSLELPSLGGGWRRRKRGWAEPAPVEPTIEPPTTGGGRTTVVETAEVADAPPAPSTPRERRLPTLELPGGWPAVVVTGLVAGLVLVGLTWASLQACEEVQGTSTCGRAGYPMLALVLAVGVLVGAVLLRLAQVPDPVSTSLLGVGLAAVVALVFLIDHLDQPAVVVVIPLVCALTYAGAHWLTTAVIEPGGD
jgi:hypothetical protein